MKNFFNLISLFINAVIVLSHFCSYISIKVKWCSMFQFRFALRARILFAGIRKCFQAKKSEVLTCDIFCFIRPSAYKNTTLRGPFRVNWWDPEKQSKLFPPKSGLNSLAPDHWPLHGDEKENILHSMTSDDYTGN